MGKNGINQQLLSTLSQNQLAIAAYKLGIDNTKMVKGGIVVECQKKELISKITRQLAQGTFSNRIENLKNYLEELGQYPYQDWGENEIDKITAIQQVKKAWNLLDEQQIFNLIVTYIETADPDCYEEFDEICEKLGFLYDEEEEEEREYELIYPSQRKLAQIIKNMNYAKFYHSVIFLARWQKEFSNYSNYPYRGGTYYIPTSFILSLGEFTHKLSEAEALQYLMRWLKTESVGFDKYLIWDTVTQSLKEFWKQKKLILNKVIVRKNPLKEKIENLLKNENSNFIDESDIEVLSWHSDYAKYLIVVALVDESIEIETQNLSEIASILDPHNYVQKREQYQERYSLMINWKKQKLTFSEIDQAINWGRKILNHHFEVASLEEVMLDLEDVMLKQLNEKVRQDLTELFLSISTPDIDNKKLYQDLSKIPLNYELLELEEGDFCRDEPTQSFLDWLNRLRKRKTYWLIESQSVVNPNLKLYYPYGELTKKEREFDEQNLLALPTFGRGRFSR